MNKRLSSYFGFTSPSSNPPQDEQDTGSVTSEVSSGVASTDSPKRNNFFSRSSVDPLGDGNIFGIDDLMRNLYQDPDILERQCHASIRGDKYIDNQDLDDKIENIQEELQDKPLVLPPHFFDPYYDPVYQNLLDVATWDLEDHNEKFMVNIEEADSFQDEIILQLTVTLEANMVDLMANMRDVHEIDLDLARAAKQVHTERKHIKVHLFLFLLI